MRHLTIRTRLTVLYGGLFLLAGMALLAVTYILVQHSLDGRDQPGGKIGFSVTKPLNGGPPVLMTTDGRQISVEDAGKELAAAQQKFRSDTLNSLLKEGGIALGAVGVAAVGFGWLVSERVLRPLHRITDTARRVADRSLHERIALTGPRDEIKELADTFDSMLERLDRSFDGQRRFVGNASHELRTPLAINRTLIEVALASPDATPRLTQLGETLLAVNARHERLIDGLLTLAGSEQAVTLQDPVDLADVARHVVEQASPGDLEIVTSLDPAPTSGDPILLERVVQNLVQNAIVHNTAGGWLSVTTANGGGVVQVTVSNTGPVIPGYEVPGLFEPFRRLHERVGSSHGTGLGLSIVRSVTRAHGGDVSARPRDGGGLVVTIRLPASVTGDS